jgi:excisionase family DNA binding protein
MAVKNNIKTGEDSSKLPFALYTIDQAAAILGIARRGLQQRAANREIASIRIGRSTRFSAADIADFVERNKVKAMGWKGGGR